MPPVCKPPAAPEQKRTEKRRKKKKKSEEQHVNITTPLHQLFKHPMMNTSGLKSVFFTTGEIISGDILAVYTQLIKENKLILVFSNYMH